VRTFSVSYAGFLFFSHRSFIFLLLVHCRGKKFFLPRSPSSLILWLDFRSINFCPAHRAFLRRFSLPVPPLIQRSVPSLRATRSSPPLFSSVHRARLPHKKFFFSVSLDHVFFFFRSPLRMGRAYTDGPILIFFFVASPAALEPDGVRLDPPFSPAISVCCCLLASLVDGIFSDQSLRLLFSLSYRPICLFPILPIPHLNPFRARGTAEPVLSLCLHRVFLIF